jgi:hypothetical protein
MSADYSGGSSDALSRIFLRESYRPQQSISREGAMSEMRYANTKILIVTCYLLLQG